MGISQTPELEIFPYRATEQFEPTVERYCPLPTVCDVKDNKLFGIPLKSALTGESLKDKTVQFYINSAISEIEHMLDLYITPVKFVETHDYERHRFTWTYNYMKLDHPNILSISKVELSFDNNPQAPGFVSFPLEHVYVRPQEGVFQLVPAFGTSLSGFLLSAFSGTQFHALQAVGATNFPGGVRVEYTAGFAQDKVPASICELIQTIAAINVLSTLGPILFPNTSVSISVDGASQSTGGFGPKYLNDRIDQLKEERDRMIDVVKGYYQRRFLIDNV
jgi:hypothetical protein